MATQSPMLLVSEIWGRFPRPSILETSLCTDHLLVLRSTEMTPKGLSQFARQPASSVFSLYGRWSDGVMLASRNIRITASGNDHFATQVLKSGSPA